MRLIVLLLLLANVGFFAWFGVYAPPPAQAEATPPALPEVPRLVLLTETPATDEEPVLVAVSAEETRLAQADPVSATDSDERAEASAREEETTPADAETSAPVPGETAASPGMSVQKASPPPAVTDLKPVKMVAHAFSKLAGARVVESAASSENEETSAPSAAEAEESPARIVESAASSENEETSAPSAMETKESPPEPTPATAKTTAMAARSPAAETAASPTKPRPPSSPPGGEGSVCWRSGPYKLKGLALQAQARLRKVQVKARIIGNREKRKVSTWIYLPPYPSRGDADFVDEMLTRQGIDDHYVVSREDYANAVSLGLYRNEEGAQRRLSQLRAKGYYNVQAEARFEMYTVYWLQFRAPPEVTNGSADRARTLQELQVQRNECMEIAISPEIP